MTAEVFYRKWRPQTLADVVGQEPVTRTLQNALKSDRISHAYIFYGPRGTGKTSTARILAKAVNCLNNGKGEPCNNCAMCQAIADAKALDVIEIDAASNTGVDDIRNLREKVNYAPNQARYKVYIIDEVHMLSTPASNALLKTLEEPPPHVIFILATTEVHKILPTILSRCQRFDFRRLSSSDVTSKLSLICEAEGIKLEPEALSLIARSTTGSLRDAENLLEQLTTYYGSEIELQQVQATLGITGDWRTRELTKHIINNNLAEGISTINSVNTDGLDLRQFNRELVEYLRALLLIKTDSREAIDLTSEEVDELKELADNASLPQILRAVKVFGQLELGLDNYSTLPLELALVECALAENKEPQIQTEPVERKPRSPSKKVETVATTKTEKPATEPEAAPEPESAPVVEISPEAKQEPEPESTPEPEPEPVATSTNQPGETDTKDSAAMPLEASNETELLKLNWKQVIRQAPEDTRKTSVLALLRSAQPVSVDDDTVSLSFKHSYHREQIEKSENQRIAERIISSFLGHPCQIRCVTEDNHLVNEALKRGAEITDVEEQ